MSIKIMSWVLDHSPYRGKARLVHLVLADHADDDGLCWPNQGTVAKRAGCTVETVRTTTRQMQADGLIEIVRLSRGRGSSHHYRLRTPKSLGVVGLEHPKSTAETPKSNPRKPPNLSSKNHQESSIEPPQATAPLEGDRHG